MDDSSFPPYDPLWDQLIPNGPDTAFSDFDSTWNSFQPNTNRSTSSRNPAEPAFDPFTSASYNTNNHRPFDPLRGSNGPSTSSNNLHSSTSTHRTYNESAPEPLPIYHDHQQPADTSAFDFPFVPDPQPSQTDQSIRLPGIDSITQDPTSTDCPTSRFSWDSTGGDSLFADSGWWQPDGDYSDFNIPDLNGFIDLTADSSPPQTMPPTTRKRRASAMATPAPATPPRIRSNKRRKISDVSVKDEAETKVEQLDLFDVDDDDGLSQVLEQQQAVAIQEQQKQQGDQPTKLSALQCIICMESMTDMTVTHCGEPRTSFSGPLLVSISQNS